MICGGPVRLAGSDGSGRILRCRSPDLENHGYMIAEATVSSWGQALNPKEYAYTVPHPEYLEPERVREALAESHINRIPLGRG